MHDTGVHRCYVQEQEGRDVAPCWRQWASTRRQSRAPSTYPLARTHARPPSRASPVALRVPGNEPVGGVNRRVRLTSQVEHDVSGRVVTPWLASSNSAFVVVS
jgi:hypothetical protein